MATRRKLVRIRPRRERKSAAPKKPEIEMYSEGGITDEERAAAVFIAGGLALIAFVIFALAWAWHG